MHSLKQDQFPLPLHPLWTRDQVLAPTKALSGVWCGMNHCKSCGKFIPVQKEYCYDCSLKLNNEIDYKSLSVSLICLLDRIEMITTEKNIHDICKQRFQLAQQHGIEIEFGEFISGNMQ